jgi:hypothetical protein
MTNESISKRLIDAVIKYGNAIRVGTIDSMEDSAALNKIEQLAQEVELLYCPMEDYQSLAKENYERESLWVQLDKAYQIPTYVFAQDAIPPYKRQELIDELRRKLGLGEE